MRIDYLLCFLVFGAALSSCGSYKQNIMFRTAETERLKQQASQAETNYTIARNDLLQLEVHTNQGEKLIDPNLEAFKDSPVTNATATKPTYLVDAGGIVRFPMAGDLKLEGLTLRQAEEILQKEYAKFYEEPFVVLRFASKRVIVLGAPGGQVIPLTNENVRLTEVLALAKGVNNDAKAKNIRVLRGNTVMVADFSTFERYRQNDFVIQPGDIVYVEPVRRPFSEALREYGPVLSIITSLATLIVVITRN